MLRREPNVRAGSEKSPLHEFKTLVRLRSEIDADMDALVARVLDAGYSYGDLARTLGISRQAAHRRFRHLAGTSR